MVEATREARRISRTTPLVELVPGPEISTGEAVCDDAGWRAQSKTCDHSGELSTRHESCSGSGAQQLADDQHGRACSVNGVSGMFGQ